MHARRVLVRVGWGLWPLAVAALGGCRQRHAEAADPASAGPLSDGLAPGASLTVAGASATPFAVGRDSGTGESVQDGGAAPSASAAPAGSAPVAVPSGSGHCRCKPDDPLCSCYGDHPEPGQRPRCDCTPYDSLCGCLSD